MPLMPEIRYKNSELSQMGVTFCFMGNVGKRFGRFRMVNLLGNPCLNCRGYVVRGVDSTRAQVRLEIIVVVVTGTNLVSKVVRGRAVETVEVVESAAGGR